MRTVRFRDVLLFRASQYGGIMLFIGPFIFVFTILTFLLRDHLGGSEEYNLVMFIVAILLFMLFSLTGGISFFQDLRFSMQHGISRHRVYTVHIILSVCFTLFITLLLPILRGFEYMLVQSEGFNIYFFGLWITLFKAVAFYLFWQVIITVGSILSHFVMWTRIVIFVAIFVIIAIPGTILDFSLAGQGVDSTTLMLEHLSAAANNSINTVWLGLIAVAITILNFFLIRKVEVKEDDD